MICVSFHQEDLKSRIEAIRTEEPVAELGTTTVTVGDEGLAAQMSLDPDDPDALTLKQVHDWLLNKIDYQETIDVTDPSVSCVRVLILFFFVVEDIFKF